MHSEQCICPYRWNYYDFMFKRSLCQCICRVFSICELISSCLPHHGIEKTQSWLMSHCFCLGHNLKLTAACVDNYFYIYNIKSFKMLTPNTFTMNIFVVFVVVVNIINSMHFVMCVSTCLWKAILLEKESFIVYILRLIRNLTFECLVANKPGPCRFCMIKLSLYLGL